ncbi:MAG: hypothetical protein MJZ76_04630 [Bacteroidales bacterium]|nr:hypothetical protein [Bacteroidales bacterium]
MKVIITGTTGYVGEGVMRCCLEHPMVEKVLSVSRKKIGLSHSKLEELVVDNFMDLQSNDIRLGGYDAAFFIAGVSSIGCPRQKYYEISRTIPMHFAEIMPDKKRMTFIYLSGSGTNAQGKLEWQKIKGRTENLLAEMPFKRTFGFRPAFMKPHKEQRNRPAFQLASRLFYPLFRIFNLANTMQEVADAMIVCAMNGYENRNVEVVDIKKMSAKGEHHPSSPGCEQSKLSSE